MDFWIACGGLTTISFLPQVIKTWKSKSAKDLSLNVCDISSTGVSWLIYGINISSIPLITANALTLILCLTILYFVEVQISQVTRINCRIRKISSLLKPGYGLKWHW
jgi:MtN3 and saliva related transmembrane protein